MSAGGVMPAGSCRMLRLDPLALPVRYTATDAGADGRVRQVELHRECVKLKRAVRGMRMKLDVPLSSYRGVAVQILSPGEAADLGAESGAVAVTLAHRDPGLSIPLFIASDTAEVGEQWRAWAQALNQPLLIVAADGTLRDPFKPQLITGESAPRRRRRHVIARRRSTISFRRAKRRDVVRVYLGEREIIAPE